MYCKKCGKEIDASAVACPHCGATTENYQKPKGSVVRLVIGIISIVLCVFIGLQSCAAGLGNTLSENGEVSGSAGLLLAICFLVAGIVGIATRRGKAGGITAGCIYALGSLLGITNYGSYSDLLIWSILGFIFAAVFIISGVRTGSAKAEKDQ